MGNYKNQITIKNISVEKIKHIEGVEESYLQWLQWDAIMTCMSLLSGNEFKLYMYLLKWAGKTYYNFSPVDIYRQLGFKKDTARSARKTLEEYGFLTLVKNGIYTFDPLPEKAINEAAKKKLERIEDSKDEV